MTTQLSLLSAAQAGPTPDLQSRLLEGLNPEQAAAVQAPIDAALQIMAGAGTGKTEVITRRVVSLASQLQAAGTDRPMARLWVSTFTEKAAREMQERIGSYLQAETGMTVSTDAWIGTFHGLCRRLLQRHTDRLPNGSERALLNETEQEILREGLLARLLTEAIALGPNGETAEDLMDSDLGDAEVFFWELLTQVVPRLKATGLSPEQFLQDAQQQAVAYAECLRTLPVTQAFSGELFDSHDAFASAWHPHIAPYGDNRFAFMPSDWELDIHHHKARRKGDDPPAPATLMRKQLKALYDFKCFVHYDGKQRKAPFFPASKDFSGLDGALDRELRLVQLIAGVYRLYQTTLDDAEVWDFDDLITQSVSLLTRHPDIQAAYREQFAHYLVDEFQDSNGSQLQLVRALANPERPPLTVVGDAKQSIYAFRFAEPDNLETVFTGAAERMVLPLYRNYRSHPDILAVANRVTDMMALPQPAPLSTGRTWDDAARPYDPVTWLDVGDAANIAEAKSAEVRWIAETIAQLLADETVAPHEIAVLTRDHRKTLAVEAALEAFGIPSVKQRNLGFFRQPVIRQAMALLGALADPDDDFAFIGALEGRLPHERLAALSRHRRAYAKTLGQPTVSYRTALQDLLHGEAIDAPDWQPYQPLLQYFTAEIMDLHRRQAYMRPQHLFDRMLQRFPLLSEAEMTTVTGQKAFRQLALLYKLLYYWADRSRTPLTLPDALDRLRRMQRKDDLEVPVDAEPFLPTAVRLLTVHGSKGLEFPVVFLAGVASYRASSGTGLLTVDPQYPGKPGFGLILNRLHGEKTLKKTVYDLIWQSPRAKAEELRLFYVGVTRARDRLYISSWPASFPYMDPAFFENLPLQTETLDTVAWLDDADRRALSQTLHARFFPGLTLKS